ncbi:MAG: hypothetical protein V3V16_15510 [Melioribacteraceae bacterium]
MVTIEQGLGEIKNNLYLVMENLDEISEENFDYNMKTINSLTQEIKNKRDILEQNFPNDELKVKSDSLHTMIKQVTTKLDNIIRNKKEEQSEISLTLSNMANKKKLINYQR